MHIYIFSFLICLFFASILMEVQKLDTDVITMKNITLKKKHFEYILLMLSMTPLIFVSGVRFEIGYDYIINYAPSFDAIATNSPIPRLEWGYVLLNKIIIAVGGGHLTLFTVTSIIIIAVFFVAFYQQSDNIVLTIMTFFCAETFFASLDLVRQFMSLAVVYYGFKYIKSKSFIKFMVCILIAATFHRSAFLLIPLYFLQFIKISPIIISAMIALVTIFNEKFVELVKFLVSKTMYANYVNSVVALYSRWFEHRENMYLILFIISVYYYYKKGGKNDPFFVMMQNAIALLLVLGLNANLLPETFRITKMHELVLLPFVPYIVKMTENKWAKNAMCVFLLTLLALATYHNIVFVGQRGVLPYRWIFNPDKRYY